MNLKRTYLILGGTGQDGRILTGKILDNKNNRVVILHRVSTDISNFKVHSKYFNSNYDKSCLEFVAYDYSNNNISIIENFINKYTPDYIVNFASTSSIEKSILSPFETISHGFITHHLILEVLRKNKLSIPYLYSGSLEMFHPNERKCSVNTLPDPSNPYGLIKSICFTLSKEYRLTYNVNAMTIIFSNHESYLRTERFVTGKIFKAALDAYRGLEVKLVLGSNTAKRDWGLADEYMDVVLKMLNQTKKNDLILATGVNINIEELTKLSFDFYGLDYKRHVIFDESLSRSTDSYYREILPEELNCSIISSTITRNINLVVKKLSNEWNRYA